MAIGAVAAAGAVSLLLTGSSWPIVFLEILLVLAGLDRVVTGALGYCPLYKRLGYVPSSLRSIP